jgi:DNA-binding transcriptional MerR regulator
MDPSMRGGGGQDRRTQIVDELLGRGMKLSDVKTYLELYRISNDKQLPAGAIEKMNDTRAAVAKLQNLQESLNNASGTGPIFGRITNLNPFDSERKALETQTQITGRQLARAIEGSRMTDADAAFYMDQLPSTSDTKATATKKINKLMQMLQESAMQSQQGYSQGGYYGM